MPFAVFAREWRAFTPLSPYWCFDFTSDEDLYGELTSLAVDLAQEYGIRLEPGDEAIDIVGEAAGWLRPADEVTHPFGPPTWSVEVQVKDDKPSGGLIIPPLVYQTGTPEEFGWRIKPIPPPAYLSQYFHVTYDERIAVLLSDGTVWLQMTRAGYHFVADASEILNTIAIDGSGTEFLACAARQASNWERMSSEDLNRSIKRLVDNATPPDLHLRTILSCYTTRLPKGFVPETAASRARMLLRKEATWRAVTWREATFAVERRLSGEELKVAQAGLSAIRNTGSEWIPLTDLEQVGVPKTTVISALECAPEARRGGHGDKTRRIEAHRSFLFWYLGYVWKRTR